MDETGLFVFGLGLGGAMIFIGFLEFYLWLHRSKDGDSLYSPHDGYLSIEEKYRLDEYQKKGKM